MSTPVRKPDLRRAISPPPPQHDRSSTAPLAAAAAGLLSVAYAVFFGLNGLQRYRAYQMHAQDMGNMGQAAWNTLHGHPFFFTNIRLPFNIEAWGTTTRLSLHVEPIFPLISLVYALYPGPEALIVLQTVAIVLGVLPVYLLAEDVLGSRATALGFCAAYLLSPSLEGMNLYEFHPVALATPLLLGAFLFAHRRQPVPFTVCALLAMATKEEMGLVVALLGLYAAYVDGQRRVGVGLALFGAFWSLFAVLVIEHHFRQPGTVTYFHSRYHYLGHGLSGAAHTILRDPGAIGAVLFVWPKAAYIRLLLAPVGFLALLAPEVLIVALPTLGLNLLSTEFHMFSGVGQDSAEIIAVVMVAAIQGTRRMLLLLQGRFSRRTSLLAISAYITVSALWSQVAFGYTPIGSAYSWPSDGPHQRVEDRFVRMVPSGVPVATQDELDPHLSSRHYLYLFGDTGRIPPLAPANDVVLDVSAPLYAYSSADIYGRAMTLLRSGWGVAGADDGLIYLRKGVTRRTIPSSFYSFLRAGTLSPEHRVHGAWHTLSLVGYDVSQTDKPNHRIPNLQYTVYLRPRSRLSANVEPVIFQVLNGRSISCVQENGLDWLPTSRWKPDTTYRVPMQTLETAALTPGTARLELAILPMSPNETCTSAWNVHPALYPVGTQTLSW